MCVDAVVVLHDEFININNHSQQSLFYYDLFKKTRVYAYVPFCVCVCTYNLKM